VRIGRSYKLKADVTFGMTHTTHRPVAKQKLQINKSKISYRRQSMTWGRDERTSFLIHFGHIGQLKNPHWHVTILARLWKELPLTC
jgi:hypothetical protein